MLLILSASSFRKAVSAGRGGIDLLDLPRYALDELGLRGLLVPTDMLAGADANRIDKLRERADKALCPCLFMVEPAAHRLCEGGEHAAAAASARLERVLVAAQRLGCSAAGVCIAGQDTDTALELAAERLKPLAARAERLDLSLLIHPVEGLTARPERVADLIKKVGGFRLGSMPDFRDGAASGDASGYLRRLAPYAPVVTATAIEFDDAGAHQPYSLDECADALVTVGFDGAVALDYQGKGDVSRGLRLTREAIEGKLLGAET